MFKVGQNVFAPEHDTYGTIRKITVNGKRTTYQIQWHDDDEVNAHIWHEYPDIVFDKGMGVFQVLEDPNDILKGML